MHALVSGRGFEGGCKGKRSLTYIETVLRLRTILDVVFNTTVLYVRIASVRPEPDNEAKSQ